MLPVQAIRVLAQNRRWSLVWNLGAVPFAALGFVPPRLAGIGISLSSLAVVLNSLRIREVRAPDEILVVSIAGIVTVACFAAMFWWIFRPGERDPHHPKYAILRRDR